MNDVLREVINTMQVRGEPRRRWFASHAFDLVVWLGEGDDVVGFQLCYGKPTSEKALTWRAGGKGLIHMTVDDGESGNGRYKSTPILTPGGEWNAAPLLRDFLQIANLLPAEIKALVVDQLELAVATGNGITCNSAVTPGGASQ